MRHPSNIAFLGSLPLLGLALAAGCASASPDAAPERTGAATEAVDLTAINANQAAIVQDGSIPARATGVAFIPFLDASHNPAYVPSTQYTSLPLRGSCGITFVSPHYAITASHCFANSNVYDPANQAFTAQSIDVSLANKDDFYFDSTMQGTFPNYTPLFGHTMDQAAGYTTTAFTCRIASRCAWSGGASAYNCDGVSAPDVTMLYCGDRSAYGAWLPVAADSATSGAVYMYWFHELFNTNNNSDMIAHYTNLGAQASNWHYLGAPTNKYLPFKSVAWPSGAQRSRIGAGGDTDVRTDLYGCHGTSGSGVLSMTSSGYALLGPVHAPLWSASTLCDDPNFTQGAAGHGLTYNSNVSVNALVNAKYLSTLQSDRPPPPPYCGDGACNGTETHTSCPADCAARACRPGTYDCCDDGVCRTGTVCQRIGCF